MDILFFLVLFLLPVFPFSLLTNKFLLQTDKRFFTVFIIIFFILGNLMLIYIKIDSKIVQFLAIFTLLFYSFRLLGVNNLKIFILYIYTIISSISLLWYLIGGNMIEFMLIKMPLLISFLTLFYFLNSQFSIIHKKSLRGLATVMPRFSILFILSLLGIDSSLLFLGYEFLEIEFAKLPIIYGFILIVSWVLINWASIKLIEWLIFTQYRTDRKYIDLSLEKSLFLISLLVLDISVFVYYAVKGLV